MNHNLLTTREGNALKIVFTNHKKTLPNSPFAKWHLKTKFEVISQLFDRYLTPGCRFIDIACGDGDGIVLAEECEPACELWGVDIDTDGLEVAKERVPNALLLKGDMLHLDQVKSLPKKYFDLLHEFGATFFIRDWKSLFQQYIKLVRPGGIILWELPQKWSMANFMYLFTPAPKITEEDTKIKRIFRSFLPWKYNYLSDKQIDCCLATSGYDYEIIERFPIWYFYANGLFRLLLDRLHFIFGDQLFNILDRINSIIWPRYSGFYLVIQRK